MRRREFLRSSLILGGGLVVGEEALEAFARLTHVRKSFPSARWVPQGVIVTDAEIHAMLKQCYTQARERIQRAYAEALRGPYNHPLPAARVS